MYAVHEYQTSEEDNRIKFWETTMLFPLYSFSFSPFCPTFLKPVFVPKNWGLVGAVSSPPSVSGRTRLLNILSAFYCALLCIMDVIKLSVFNKFHQEVGDKTLRPPYFSK